MTNDVTIAFLVDESGVICENDCCCANTFRNNYKVASLARNGRNAVRVTEIRDY
jgi:hypothetical protein